MRKLVLFLIGLMLIGGCGGRVEYDRRVPIDQQPPSGMPPVDDGDEPPVPPLGKPPGSAGAPGLLCKSPRTDAALLLN